MCEKNENVNNEYGRCKDDNTPLHSSMKREGEREKRQDSKEEEKDRKTE